MGTCEVVDWKNRRRTIDHPFAGWAQVFTAETHSKGLYQVRAKSMDGGRPTSLSPSFATPGQAEEWMQSQAAFAIAELVPKEEDLRGKFHVMLPVYMYRSPGSPPSRAVIGIDKNHDEIPLVAGLPNSVLAYAFYDTTKPLSLHQWHGYSTLEVGQDDRTDAFHIYGERVDSETGELRRDRLDSRSGFLTKPAALTALRTQARKAVEPFLWGRSPRLGSHPSGLADFTSEDRQAVEVHSQRNGEHALVLSRDRLGSPTGYTTGSQRSYLAYLPNRVFAEALQRQVAAWEPPGLAVGATASL